jgi:hypothetical protein
MASSSLGEAAVAPSEENPARSPDQTMENDNTEKHSVHPTAVGAAGFADTMYKVQISYVLMLCSHLWLSRFTLL